MIEDKDHRTIARHIFQPGDLDAAEVNPESKSQEATDNSPDHVWYGTACGSKRVLLVNAVYALPDGRVPAPLARRPLHLKMRAGFAGTHKARAFKQINSPVEPDDLQAQRFLFAPGFVLLFSN